MNRKEDENQIFFLKKKKKKKTHTHTHTHTNTNFTTRWLPPKHFSLHENIKL